MREIPQCSRGLGHGYAFLFVTQSPFFYASAFTIRLVTLPIGLRLYPPIAYIRILFVGQLVFFTLRRYEYIVMTTLSHVSSESDELHYLNFTINVYQYRR
jgi:hypothetical protein